MALFTAHPALVHIEAVCCANVKQRDVSPAELNSVTDRSTRLSLICHVAELHRHIERDVEKPTFLASQEGS